VTKLTSIEGIGPAYAAKLNAAGVGSVEALLQSCATASGRRALADESGISGDLILRWANAADLFRIKGVSEEYAELLEAAGVDTVPELARRNGENLLAALRAANAEKSLVRRLPGLSQVEAWITQAQGLPRALTY
jgi:predicted flap endonuclease-1-like 5' DNA nuclease